MRNTLWTNTTKNTGLPLPKDASQGLYIQEGQNVSISLPAQIPVAETKFWATAGGACLLPPSPSLWDTVLY